MFPQSACKMVHNVLSINWKYSYLKSILRCNCDAAIVTHLWHRFVVANATLGNTVNVTSEIFCQENEETTSLMWHFCNVISSLLCLLDIAFKKICIFIKCFNLSLRQFCLTDKSDLLNWIKFSKHKAIYQCFQCYLKFK